MPLEVEEQISSIAVEAILHEAAATPKPGLVDRNNSGAHSDMDFFTFISSASVLHPFFLRMAHRGSSFNQADFSLLLTELRPIGIEAEEAMYSVTGGVNTHKGIIFSLGILVSAASYLMNKKKSCDSKEICSIASKMCTGIVNNELVNHNNETTTGEKLYKSEGIRGIRGEAEQGFPSVIKTGLPSLKKSRGIWNNRLLDTLLHLMSVVEDSNIVGRKNRKTLESVQKQTSEVLNSGGAADARGMEILKQIDLNFIEQNISPGGTADLLAVTIFLYKIEELTDCS